MMSENDFTRMIDEIVAQGYDLPTAGRYAALIGDLPIMQEGKLVVMDGGKVIATLEPLKLFATQ